jgi:predicted permease
VLAVAGKAFDARTAAHDVASQSVSPDYFQTAEVPLLAGRRFTAADRQDTVSVAIINARLAQLYFPAGDALGRQIKLGSPEDKAEQWLTVVGVVGNVKTTTVFQEMGYLTLPAVYRPLAQTPGKAGKLLLRTEAEPLGMVEKVQQAAAGATRDVVLSNIETAQGMLREQNAQPRFRTVLLGGFAGMALVLAMLGIYGLLAQQVIQRTLEIGIRMALGANRRHVVAAIVRQALGLTAVGIALGLAGSFAADRVMAGLLYETSASDPWVLSAVALVFVCVAAAASFLPAWRASHVEPMVAMRAE